MTAVTVNHSSLGSDKQVLPQLPWGRLTEVKLAICAFGSSDQHQSLINTTVTQRRGRESLSQGHDLWTNAPTTEPLSLNKAFLEFQGVELEQHFMTSAGGREHFEKETDLKKQNYSNMNETKQLQVCFQEELHETLKQEREKRSVQRNMVLSNLFAPAQQKPTERCLKLSSTRLTQGQLGSNGLCTKCDDASFVKEDRSLKRPLQIFFLYLP